MIAHIVSKNTNLLNTYNFDDKYIVNGWFVGHRTPGNDWEVFCRLGLPMTATVGEALDVYHREHYRWSALLFVSHAYKEIVIVKDDNRPNEYNSCATKPQVSSVPSST